MGESPIFAMATKRDQTLENAHTVEFKCRVAAPLAAASFSELTQNLLGAALDERLLVAWLHRRPMAGPEGWEVTIDESQRLGGQALARRVTATQGDVVVKLVVDDYRPRPD